VLAELCTETLAFDTELLGVRLEALDLCLKA